jgi:hypothetical protein
MREQTTQLMQQAGTDTSGKWVSIDNAEKLIELIILKCKDAVEKTDPTTAQRAIEAINREFDIK